MIIPRAKLTLPFKAIIVFIFNLFLKKNPDEAEKIKSDFEINFASRYGFPQGLTLSKARVAFYFLLKKLGLKKGGEVLISAIHIADFINMITLAGYKPIVVDLQKNSYCVDYEDLENKINKNTVLILITHLSGYVTNMEKIVDISNKHNVPFIEDCSQVVSSSFKGNPLGTFGKAAIFSLSFLKPVCAITGGMIISHDAKLLLKMREATKKFKEPLKSPLIIEALKNIIIKTAVSKFVFPLIVFPLLRFTLEIEDFFAKYQKSNKTIFLRKKMPQEFLVKFSWQQAVLGLNQLETLDKREAKRTASGMQLYESLKSLDSITLPPVTSDSKNTFWLFPVMTKNPTKLQKHLACHGIDSSKFLLSVLSDEPVFAFYNFKCDNSTKIKAHTIFIPMYSELSDDARSHIISVLKSYKP